MDYTNRFNSFALKKLPADGRDLLFGSIFTLPTVESLPDNFVVGQPLVIKDQKNTDYCSCFSSTSVSEDQENVVLDPLWQFMKSKVIEGDPNGFGCDLRSVAKSFTKFGSIEATQSPYNIDTPREIIVNPSSWKDKNYDFLAEKHIKESYAFVSGSGDFFDNIRATMFHGKKQSVVFGMDFCVGWLMCPGGIVDSLGMPVSGHAIKLFGWQTINGQPYMLAQLSNGTDIGANGIFKLSRTVINAQQGYGAVTFTAYDPDAMLTHQNLGVKLDQNFLIRWVQLIANFIHLKWPTQH
jgi:hypothetical protein